MARSFSCPNCQSVIKVFYLNPGEKAQCKACRAIVKVPESSSEDSEIFEMTPASGGFVSENRSFPPDTNHDKLTCTLKLMIIATAFYYFNLTFFSDTTVFRLAIIGNGMMLIVWCRVLRQKWFQYWVLVGLLITVLNATSNILVIFGHWTLTVFELEKVGLAAVLAFLYKLSKLYPNLSEHATTIKWAVVTLATGWILDIALIVVAPFTAWAVTLLTQNPGLAGWITLFGLFGPTFFLHLIAAGLFFYVLGSIYFRLKRLQDDDREIVEQLCLAR